jgi:superfamily I DNA/RNA helicase
MVSRTKPSTAAAGAQAPALRLLPPENLASAPTLDGEQREVVAHRGTPLLVLAGPGTGKTTTLVEAMIDRLTGDGALEPEHVLGLTFGRDAAAQWRDRVALRLGGRAPMVSTFHSYAFAIVRKYAADLHLQGPPRLLAGYEEQTHVRELIAAAMGVKAG